MPRRDTDPMTSDAKTSDVVESQADDSSPLVLDPHNQDVLKKIEQSNLGDRMKRALKRVASGEPIRAAALAEGYESHSDLWRYCKRFEIVDLKTKALVERHRRVSTLAGSELEMRLVEKPESFSNQALGVLQGIGTDKAILLDKGATYDGNAYLAGLNALAALAGGGQGVEIRVAVSPLASGADGVIDVTPTSDVSTGR